MSLCAGHCATGPCGYGHEQAHSVCPRSESSLEAGRSVSPAEKEDVTRTQLSRSIPEGSAATLRSEGGQGVSQAKGGGRCSKQRKDHVGRQEIREVRAGSGGRWELPGDFNPWGTCLDLLPDIQPLPFRFTLYTSVRIICLKQAQSCSISPVL